MIIVCSRLPEKSKSSRIRPQVPWYKISFIHRKAGFFPTNTLLALLRCSPEMSRFWRRKVILWYVDHWLSLKPTGGWILSGFQGSCCLSSFVNVIYQHKGGQLSTLWYTEKIALQQFHCNTCTATLSLHIALGQVLHIILRYDSTHLPSEECFQICKLQISTSWSCKNQHLLLINNKTKKLWELGCFRKTLFSKKFYFHSSVKNREVGSVDFCMINWY